MQFGCWHLKMIFRRIMKLTVAHSPLRCLRWAESSGAIKRKSKIYKSCSQEGIGCNDRLVQPSLDCNSVIFRQELKLVLRRITVQCFQ